MTIRQYSIYRDETIESVEAAVGVKGSAGLTETVAHLCTERLSSELADRAPGTSLPWPFGVSSGWR
jgi:hypothetical protein